MRKGYVRFTLSFIFILNENVSHGAHYIGVGGVGLVGFGFGLEFLGLVGGGFWGQGGVWGWGFFWFSEEILVQYSTAMKTLRKSFPKEINAIIPISQGATMKFIEEMYVAIRTQTAPAFDIPQMEMVQTSPFRTYI